MTDEEKQARHAEIFGETSKAITRAAFAFARETAQTFSAMDSAKLYLVAAATLANSAEGPSGAATMLRECADAVERGDGLAKPN
jgi:hypothetical protein